MRCPDCNKFVSFEQEVEDVELEYDGETLSGSVRVVLKCADCGNELKECTMDVSHEHAHDCKKKKKDEDSSFDVDSSAEPSDRYDGKEGTPMRYRKHFYGADITATATCSACEQAEEIQTNVEERASGFDELV